MPYTPGTTTTTLVVQLGNTFQGSFTAGSPNLASVGFAFAASDVGNVIMVLSGGADGLSHATWTTVLAFTDSSHIVLNANIPDNSIAIPNVILYRPVANTPPNMIQSGTLEVDLSLTQDSTAQFVLESIDGSLIPTLGTPVLITDTEVSVDYFGGTIDQVQSTNEPGNTTLVYSQCQCVSWNIIMRRRTTGVSDAIFDGDATFGAANPSHGQFVNNRADQIITYWSNHAFFDDGVRLSLDTSGPKLPTFSSIGSKISDALDQLVAASTPVSGSPQFQWFIDPRRVLNWIKHGTIAAPFNISDQDGSLNNFLALLQNTVSRQNYFNRGLAEITQVSQTFVGDGSSTSFTLAQAIPITALGQVSITVNSNSQNVGVTGVDIGKQWYYQIGSKVISQTGSATVWANNVAYRQNDVVTRSGNLYESLVSSNKNHDPATSPLYWRPWGSTPGGPLGVTDVLIVTFPVFVEFAFDAAAAQFSQQQTESGSGLWEQKINLNALNSVVDAETFVTSQVQIAKDFAQQVQVQTYKPGLNIGQTVNVNISAIGVNSHGSPVLGFVMLIDSVKITTAANRKLFTVTASLDAPLVGGWAAQLKRGMGTGGGVNAHPLAIPLSGSALAGGTGSGSVPPNTGGSGGTGSGGAQVPLANLIPVRAWVDESGRQPRINNMNNTESVSFRYNGYDFFAATCNDGTFQVFKSTDHGRTWTAIDTAHAPADLASPAFGGMTGSCAFDGGYLLHVAFVQPTAGQKIGLKDFNLSTEKWGSQYDAGTTPVASAICSVFWRPSNNSILVTYDRGPVDPSPTKSRFWGVSWNFTSATVGTPFDIGIALLTASSNVTGDVNSFFTTGIVDPSGRTHFLLQNNAATYFWYQAAELNDSVGSSEFFFKPGPVGKIQTYVTNSNIVINQMPNGLQRLAAVVVTLENSLYSLRALTSVNLSPRTNTDTDWYLGGAQL